MRSWPKFSVLKLPYPIRIHVIYINVTTTTTTTSTRYSFMAEINKTRWLIPSFIYLLLNFNSCLHGNTNTTHINFTPQPSFRWYFAALRPCTWNNFSFYYFLQSLLIPALPYGTNWTMFTFGKTFFFLRAHFKSTITFYVSLLFKKKTRKCEWKKVREMKLPACQYARNR